MKRAGRGGRRHIVIALAGILALISGGILSCGTDRHASSEEGSDIYAGHDTTDGTAGVWEERAEEIGIYQDWSDAEFLSDQGQGRITLTGKPTVLVYWASWCPHCMEGMEQMSAAAGLAEKEGASFYLVNKLDGEKETKESAQAVADEKGMRAALVYDEGAAVYQEKGLHMLPTTVVLDASGKVTSFEEGQVPQENRLLSMIQEAKAGKTAYLAASVQRNLLTEQGGVRTNYLDGDGAIPSGADELSESMGLMLGYAAGSKDRALFDKLYTRLAENGIEVESGFLYPWVVTDKQKITVNAAVDDFRIYDALKKAEEEWKDFGGAEAMEEALYTGTVSKGRLVDFYDAAMKTAADTLTLCYADFTALRQLAQQDERWEEVLLSALETVRGGRISDEFPLYYRQYDYGSGTYNKEAFHMAEEMVTLLHLAENGSLPDDTYRWVTEELYEGVIYAGYGADGRPSLDKRYESTAVYALTALLAMEKGDDQAARKALSLMEPLRVRDGSNTLDGMFGGEDGNGIYSFDQCVALAAYQQMDEIMAK